MTNAGLLRLNTDGSVDSGFATDVTNVEVMSLQPDTKLLVAEPGAVINRLNLDGRTDSDFNAQLPSNQGLAMSGIAAIAPLPMDGPLADLRPHTEKDMALVTLMTNGDLAPVQVSLRAPGAAGSGLAQVTNYQMLAFGFQPDGRLLLSGFWEVGAAKRAY